MTRSNAAPSTADDTPCEERNCLLASVVLVDSHGWLLLQERDEHALVAPNQWGPEDTGGCDRPPRRT